MKNADKVTMTVSQLKRLIKESVSDDGDFEIRNGVLVKYHGDGGDVVIPNGVVEIRSYAFWGESPVSIKSLIIPDSVKKIGSQAFEGFRALTNVTFGNSVTIIGKRAFSNCIGLTNVILPNSLTHIGEGAFYNTGLRSVIIPKRVVSIEKWAFEDCRFLKEVIVSKEKQKMMIQSMNGVSDWTKIIVDKEDSVSVNAPTGPVKVLFRTKPHIDDNAGEIEFPSINAMVQFLNAIGADYTDEIADKVVRGETVSIPLQHDIVQLGVHR